METLDVDYSPFGLSPVYFMRLAVDHQKYSVKVRESVTRSRLNRMNVTEIETNLFHSHRNLPPRIGATLNSMDPHPERRFLLCCGLGKVILVDLQHAKKSLPFDYLQHRNSIVVRNGIYNDCKWCVVDPRLCVVGSNQEISILDPDRYQSVINRIDNVSCNCLDWNKSNSLLAYTGRNGTCVVDVRMRNPVTQFLSYSEEYAGQWAAGSDHHFLCSNGKNLCLYDIRNGKSFTNLLNVDGLLCSFQCSKDGAYIAYIESNIGICHVVVVSSDFQFQTKIQYRTFTSNPTRFDFHREHSDMYIFVPNDVNLSIFRVQKCGEILPFQQYPGVDLIHQVIYDDESNNILALGTAIFQWIPASDCSVRNDTKNLHEDAWSDNET